MSGKQVTRTERLESLREELFTYVAQRDRLGTPISFLEAARGHRAQCDQNWHDDGDRIWLDRLSLLDEILDERKVPQNGRAA